MTVAMETIRSLRAVTPQNTIIEAQHVGQRFTAGNGTELTVFDNVELGLKARGVPRAERTKLALDAIDMIGLDGFESAYPKELSGGMRQRVGIARALVLRPDALFMDEPFSALDVLTAENLRQEVLKLWSSEQRSIKSVLMVTHNIEEAVEMADRVVVLGSHLGHLIADVRVDLPRPRDRHSVEFEAMVDRLYTILTGQASQPTQQAEALSPSASLTNAPVTDASVTDASDLQPAKTIEKIKEHPLPNATPGGLAGLLDVVAEHPHGIDLADLASALSRWTTCSRWWMPVRCCASSWYATAMCRSPRRATPGIRRTFCTPSRCSPHWRWNTRRWCTTLSMHCGSPRKASSAASSCWTCCAPVTPTTRRISSSPSPWSGAVTASSSITMPMTIC